MINQKYLANDPDGNASKQNKAQLIGPGSWGSSRAGGGVGTSKVKRKPISLPSYKKIRIDMKLIMSGHSKSGGRASQSGMKDLFPNNMSQKQIK